MQGRSGGGGHESEAGCAGACGHGKELTVVAVHPQSTSKELELEGVFENVVLSFYREASEFLLRISSLLERGGAVWKGEGLCGEGGIEPDSRVLSPIKMRVESSIVFTCLHCFSS